MTQHFKKTVENFVCENCGCSVEGDGYTNHCPNCLYSKHVDVHPGDRAAICGGLMKPCLHRVGTRESTLEHTCVKCGYTKTNKTSSNDNLKTLST